MEVNVNGDGWGAAGEHKLKETEYDTVIQCKPASMNTWVQFPSPWYISNRKINLEYKVNFPGKSRLQGISVRSSYPALYKRLWIALA